MVLQCPKDMVLLIESASYGIPPSCSAPDTFEIVSLGSLGFRERYFREYYDFSGTYFQFTISKLNFFTVYEVSVMSKSSEPNPL